jgi:DnaJ domain
MRSGIESSVRMASSQREVQQEQREGEREREQRAWEQQQQQRNQQEARAQQARERAQEREQEHRKRGQREREQRERAQREQRGGPRGTEQPRPWWEVLGVSEGSSLDEAKAAYRTKIKQYHPDRVVGLGEEFQQLADRKTKELNEAFNEARRRAIS